MKYYYTDHLAAQWMDSKFGMKFQEFISVMRDGKFSDEMRDIFSAHCVDFIPSMGRYYIHPDSLHLLEPKVGDFVHFDSLRNPPDKIYAMTETNYWRAGKDKSPKLGGKGVTRKRFQVTSILQRNGIPFMWPDVEE